MKKILIASLALASFVGWAGAAVQIQAAPAPREKTYSADEGWYVAANFGANFLTFKNNYSSNQPGSATGSDSYSFQSVYGGGAAFGKRFDESWRGEISGGYLGEFTDSGQGWDFALNTPYVLVSAIYDTPQEYWGGLYFGFGAGIALPTATMKTNVYETYSQDHKMAISPMGAISFGWEKSLSQSVMLGVGYKLSVFNGPTHDIEWSVDSTSVHIVSTNDIGMVLNNAFEAGLRYSF
ncbi:MAG: hypothetical protein LBO08_00655 [Rickettsiales bacterium]|jgi:hypothetical protein|nr:hypothetical protein [Rickettsiales bacterium]